MIKSNRINRPIHSDHLITTGPIIESSIHFVVVLLQIRHSTGLCRETSQSIFTYLGRLPYPIRFHLTSRRYLFS